MNRLTMRRCLIWWTYGAIAVHFLVGLLLPWIMQAPLFDSYHSGIEQAFWGQAAPPAARAQQVWWISLFGPTVQSVAIWMGALAYLGDVQRSRFAWGALIAGLLVWAPQDMLVSLRADCSIHVWIDTAALITMLPPLLWLWRHDGT